MKTPLASWILDLASWSPNWIHRRLSKPRHIEATSLDENILSSKRQLLEIFDGITDPILIVDRDFKVLRLNLAMLGLLSPEPLDKLRGEPFDKLRALPVEPLGAQQSRRAGPEQGRRADDSGSPACPAGTYNDYIGKYCFEVLHKKQDMCGECPISELFTAGAPPSQRLFEFVSGHEKRKFNVSVFPLKDKSGRIYAAVKYFKDITYLAKLEAEIYDAEKSRILGSLALGLAHEIRNPLAIISSIAQYLEKDCGDNAGIRDSMETIIRNTDIANNVIGDLLNFARPKEKKIEIAGLESVLDDGLRLLKNKLSAQKIMVEKKYDKSLPKIWLDRSIFTQAFVNIVLNAADSMASGGTITIETKGENGHACIAVSDTGKGYPPEVIDRMLKPFFRSKGGQVDLRLPIAEDIIKSHGGSVELNNNREAGATTTIRIPFIARGNLEKVN